MKLELKNDEKRELTTAVLFKNDGSFHKEDEGIPILVNECPIGVITNITDKLVEGFIFNRYMGLGYSKIDGRRCLSEIRLLPQREALYNEFE